MSSIQVLSQDLVNQIAAGEVIERPASVVKELVENAIDAGADAITVEVEGGGIDLIRVTDNGCGIAGDQLETAMLRHATSKISTTEDLFAITTLGFRGEALPSIISVSRTSVFTREKTSASGSFLIMEGGQIIKKGAKGLPIGTVVEVRDLFFNTPARKKFLKTTATEQRNIVDIISRYSLLNKDIAFKLNVNGRSLFDIPRGMSMEERIPMILGRNLRDKMRHFEKIRPGAKIRGYLAEPEISRPTRAAVYPFVNGRAVRDNTMTAAAIEGYRGLLMTRKYPVALIFLELDSADVDVNVHPAKAEVRFKNSSAVFGLIAGSIKETLAGAPQPDPPDMPSRPIFARQESQPLFPDMPPRAATPAPTIVSDTPARYTERIWPGNTTISAADAPANFYRTKNIAGTLRSTYILLEDTEALYILDQHAAHERINYEKLRRSLGENKPAVQTLLSPIILELSRIEYSVLHDIMQYLNTLGFDIYEFGTDAAAVRSVPASLSNGNIRSIIMRVIHEMLEGNIPRSNYRDDILATMACHKSIRAGKDLTATEIETLLNELDATGAPQTCPHGRPLYKKIDFYEIEKWIGRRP